MLAGELNHRTTDHDETVPPGDASICHMAIIQREMLLAAGLCIQPNERTREVEGALLTNLRALRQQLLDQG